MESNANLSLYFRNNKSYRLIAGPDGLSKWRSLVVLSAWFTVAFLVNWFQQSLWLVGDGVGLLEDPVMFLLIPMLACLTLLTRRLVRRFDVFLQDLPRMVQKSTDETTSLEDDIAAMRQFVSLGTRGSKWLHRALTALAILLVGMFQIVFPFSIPGETLSWNLLPQQYPVQFVFAIVWALFYWLVVIRSSAWYVISICFVVFPKLRCYSRALRIRVLPLASDGRGGLARIGGLSFAATLNASSGLLIAIPWLLRYGTNFPFIIGFTAYLTFLTIMFFAPLLSVHKAMKAGKQEELARWSGFFVNVYTELPDLGDRSCSTSCPTSCLQPELECLEKIERIYTRAEQIPIWPFSIATLKQFLVLILAPLLLFIIQLATQGVLTDILKAMFP